MFCPTCQTVVRTSSGPCPTCGGTMREIAAGDAVEVVETTAEVRPEAVIQTTRALPPETETLSVAASHASAALPVQVRLAELSLAAWRRPFVRAAVKTGASALALSLAMRATRHALIRPAVRRVALRSAPAALKSVLEADPPADSERDAAVIETFVYVRRVVRR